jgi:hypothetical protein
VQIIVRPEDGHGTVGRNVGKGGTIGEASSGVECVGPPLFLERVLAGVLTIAGSAHTTCDVRGFL